MPSAAARRGLRAAALVIAASLLPGGGQALASTQPSPRERGGVPSGTVDVEGQPTPVLGAFAYHEFRNDTESQIRGLVHGVHRVDGGTVLYYSVGTPAGGEATSFQGTTAFPDSSSPYDLNHGVDVELIDSEGLAAYRPLYDTETTFTTYSPDLDGDVGELRVGYAVFPPLPDSVDEVQVVMPWGTAVGDVPVEDGPLEPVGQDPAPLLGKGWPAVPQGEDLAGATPAAVTYSLVRRSGDADGTTEIEETPEQVAVTLDANVLFGSGSAELSAEAQDALTGVAADIAERGTGETVVTGHTDSDGSDDFNLALSEQRAAAVLAVLRSSSGSAVTFTSAGRGEGEPVASNSTDEGKQQNRRVTVVYSVRAES